VPTPRSYPLAALAVAGLLFGAVPASASSADPVADFTARAAAPWPGLQKPDGSFPDYIRAFSPTNSDRYGEAMLGAALIRQGTSTNSRRLVGSGLKAIDWVLHQPPSTDSSTRRFENLALVEAWLALGRPGVRAAVPRALTTAWRERLAGIEVSQLDAMWKLPRNQALIDQLIVLELVSTGIASQVPGSVLENPDAARSAAVASIAQLLSDTAVPVSAETEVGPARLLGDSPDFPPAYHALTLAMLSRLAGLIGFAPAVEELVRSRLAAAVNAAALVVAPDGDFAYSGRSPQEAWVLAMLIAGARQSMADCTTVCPASGAASRLETLALARLKSLHLDRKWGIRLVPSQAAGIRHISRSFDPYVSASAYTGLTLLGLTWAESAARPAAAEWTQPHAVAIGAARGGLGVTGSADTWFAVRSGSFYVDQRLASGLVAAKALVHGKWVNIVVAPPGRLVASNLFGVLVFGSGGFGAMTGPRVSVSGSGLKLEGSLFGSLGQPVIGSGVGRVTYEPVPCGVRMTAGPQPGVAVGLAFAVPTDRLRKAARGALDWGQGMVTPGAGMALRWEAAGPTGAAPDTSRVLAEAKPGASSRLAVTVRAKGCSEVLAAGSVNRHRL